MTAEEAKALIYARETGVVDNTACRDFSGLETLQASSLLRRLRDRGLLEKQGAGSHTHHTLANSAATAIRHPEQGLLPLEDGKQGLEGGKQIAEGGNQKPEGGKQDLPPLPQEVGRVSRRRNPTSLEEAANADVCLRFAKPTYEEIEVL